MLLKYTITAFSSLAREKCSALGQSILLELSKTESAVSNIEGSLYF